MTNTLRFPPADPAAAAAFFAGELAFEADPDDVVHDLRAGDDAGFRLVETRSREAFARVRIPGAVNLPHWEVDEAATADWDRDLVYVCYCESSQCNAATKGALALSRLGFRVKRLSGGITAWQAAGHPVEGDAVEGEAEEAGAPRGIACHC
ncbi:rhodanese-related sulfurtransferase [Saccharothrix coeruleofusca]|uniref:rhodanese-like domain-containing protein n=1 Tax=Saccharothrix coeruleofusca TaxID=33919 RepID=UPI001AEB4F8E|nr:rhodanese-like domain-containing protein [Saccharothrix coeruleofusca]MBP2333827.1 rhodanese-related sulfurtransferase [Saccharothrix coeruleofusca]